MNFPVLKILEPQGNLAANIAINHYLYRKFRSPKNEEIDQDIDFSISISPPPANPRGAVDCPRMGGL